VHRVQEDRREGDRGVHLNIDKYGNLRRRNNKKKKKKQK